jgi:molybdopterin synthase catalytic subunit
MVKVRFFAAVKEKLGREGLNLDLPECSVADVIEALKKELPDIEKTLSDSKAMTAVNHEMAGRETRVRDGDEVAFIPPFSGGEGMVRIQEGDFSLDEEIERVKKSSRRIGGIAVFLGTAREFSKGKEIKELSFEYYPGMAEKKLDEIRERAIKEFGAIEVSIVHRAGRIEIGENIVLIVAAAEHRKEAFQACQFCIDDLKRITPIWKKETTTSGEEWVEEHP